MNFKPVQKKEEVKNSSKDPVKQAVKNSPVEPAKKDNKFGSSNDKFGSKSNKK